MRISDVMGGLAVCGVVVLIGLSLAEDDSPDPLVQDPTAILVFDPAPTSDDVSAQTSTTTAAPAGDDTVASTDVAGSEPAEATTAAPASTAPPSTEPTPTAATTTTVPLLDVELWPFVEVRVLNGGAGPGAATDTTEQLRAAGFDPLSQGDASVDVAATTVLYAADRRSDALTVNQVIAAAPENVVEVSPDDPNWAEFGADLHVLVVLGPTG